MYEIQNIRKYLKDIEIINAFDALVEGRALGASSNIKAIISFSKEIIVSNCDFEEMKSILSFMFSFFDKLRGDSSIAVRNAINVLCSGLDLCKTKEDICKIITENCNYVQDKIKKDTVSIVACAANKLKDTKKLFLFDYSSTVDIIVDELFKINNHLELEIAESRILNGGLPFVLNAIKRGQKVNFITDVAMGRTIEECNAVLIGAETIYKEGSVINTPGSEIAAYCAQRANVDFFVATSFLKYDGRGESVFKNKDSIDSFSNILSSLISLEDIDKVSFSSHGYTLVPADCITGYFTEKGYISSLGFLNIDGEW